MTKDYISIGSSPCDEKCAAVGSDNYTKLMRLETAALINQMRRIHPEPQPTTPGFQDINYLPHYHVKAFPHDFGTYHEVVALYVVEHEASAKWAIEAEGLLPEKWDAEALAELSSKGYDQP